MDAALLQLFLRYSGTHIRKLRLFLIPQTSAWILSGATDARWKLHIFTPQDPRIKLRTPGERWIDPRAPDGVTILAPFEQYQPSDHPGITTGDAPAPMQLFDLQADPSEQRDVAAAHPDIVKRLRQLYDELANDAPNASKAPAS